MIKKLNFSNTFFKADYIENSSYLTVKNYGILINLDVGQIEIDEQNSI